MIANGKHPAVLRALYDGELIGTWFRPKPMAMSLRKHWIAFALRPEGLLSIDAGAVRALVEQGRSLLPIGVTRVEGDFGVGELVRIVDPEGQEVARGLVGHDAESIRVALGRPSHHLDPSAPEVVHRDDLVLLDD